MPFLLHGGTALGTGHGEAVSPILARPTTWHWVLAIADGGLSTPEVYRELDRLRGRPVAAHRRSARADELMAALRQRDPEVLGAALGNDLQAGRARRCAPQLADVLKAGYDAGALAGIVSGSGPTCVFLAADAAHAERDRRRAERRRGLPRGASPRAGPVPAPG